MNKGLKLSILFEKVIFSLKRNTDLMNKGLKQFERREDNSALEVQKKH